jgi:hypothetical protein
MNVSFGKPVLALVSAACIAVPGTADASAATGTSSSPSSISTASSFDPVPQAAASLDAATLLALLTFPYHNVYGVTVAVGNAVGAGLQVALLPVSIAALVATNQTNQVPAFVQSTMAAAAGAIPGIIKGIQAEIQYDLNLFSQLGGGSMLQKAATNSVAAVSPSSATLLALLTFPYHNIYGVTVAAGNAVGAALQVALLPVSIAALVATNQTDQVPAFVKSTMAAAGAAIPGIVKAIQAELEYDRNLFSQLGSGLASATATVTPKVESRLVNISIAPTAAIEAATPATEPEKTEKVAKTSESHESGAETTTAEAASTTEKRDGETTGEKTTTTTKSDTKPPKKDAEDATEAAGDTSEGDSESHTTTDSVKHVDSTPSKDDTAKDATSSDKSGDDSKKSEK